jgi:threonine dehydrogenase-like Zn-dependent dehydrogenase
MKCVAVEKDNSEPTIVEKPRPDPGPGEVLVKTLRVGIDGTDHEVLAGEHGAVPEDEDHLVLGHEAVGRVVDSNGTTLRSGELVAPTIRLPPAGGPNECFERAEPDMSPPDEYVERGIDGAHGFMAEYFVHPAEYLVPVPDHLAAQGFLAEPASIVMKALELARASRSPFTWSPESALVLGEGRLGLLAVALLSEFDRTYCLGLATPPDPRVEIVENLGTEYVDGNNVVLGAVPEVCEAVDLVVEATGEPSHPFEALGMIAPNGVVAALGIPESNQQREFDAGQLHHDCVLANKALVGSVCSHILHFEAGLERLGSLPEWFFEAYITGVFRLGDFEEAFSGEGIKTAITFSSLSDR